MLPLFKRTDMGRAEVKARAAGLSRAARTLLLIIDDSQPPEQWIAQVRGSTEADLFRLCELGFIVDSKKPATVQSDRASTELRDALRLIQAMPYGSLYESLNGFGKDTLGVLGAYRFSLDVERCNGLSELQAFTMKFVIRIRDQFGIEEVRRFTKHLQSSSASAIS